MGGRVTGPEAVGILIEEIGDVIGQPRLHELEGKVRTEIAKTPPKERTANDWIAAIAQVIVDDDDKRADQGFRKGIRRIRALAASRPNDPRILDA